MSDQPISTGEVRAAAERAARTSYGRLVAILAAGTRDIALAEDALADAFERALTSWPTSGVPDSPEGWLLTVARHRQSDVLGSAARRTSYPLPEGDALGARGAHASPLDDYDPDDIPDKRLELLFACAHPAIDPRVRTPLMLQAVLGFEATQIAEAFALPGPTMAQRLVRAKRRIRDAGIPFAVPDRRLMPERLGPVLEAVYGCYAIDWRGSSAPTVRESMAGEAQYLAVTLAELLGDEPEAWGLAALITLSLARMATRSAEFVPLDEQDPGLWSAALVAEGDSHLRRAADVRSAARQIGRFELEAAIQSVHCARKSTGAADWAALHTLHAALVVVLPTLGARAALAAATSHVEGPRAGLAELDAIDDPAAGRFQPAWATRAALQADAGDLDAAVTSYEKAISLTTDSPTRAWLEARLAEVRKR